MAFEHFGVEGGNFVIAKMESLIDLPIEYIDVPDCSGYQAIAIHVDATGYWEDPYTYDSKPYIRLESATVVMPRDMYWDRLTRSKGNRYKWEDQVCEGITIADLEEQRIRGEVRLGVERGRMPASSLMETTESLVEKLAYNFRRQTEECCCLVSA